METLLLGSPYGGISGQIQNPMRTLPESIGNLGNLKMMYMPGLKIESLPPSIAQLKDSLESLVLYVDDGDYTHSNPICRNPDAIVQLKEWLPNTEIVHEYVDIGYCP